MTQRILSILSILALALGFAAIAGAAEVQPGAEEPGIHGMLVVGSEAIYVSHLPMFMPQHRYQGIWEVSFGEKADATYRAERAKAGTGAIFTLAPTTLFRLPELTTTRKTFKADVFKGHFERDGNERILENVTVTVRRQVHWHPFRTSHSRPEPLTYLLFGKGKELFLAHWISVAPNYDQILSVTASASLGDLPRAAQLVLSKRGDAEALKAGDAVSGMLIVDQGPEQPVLMKPVDLKVGSVIYLEKGELKDIDLKE
ncbi:MAG TPA: hypothetical protein VGX68_27180 [Thermoanaerobaculia bacterium]|jgi:hypothetical protein|nr:hypothetical protein [Thermoanaerobaculia bacterium]